MRFQTEELNSNQKITATIKNRTDLTFFFFSLEPKSYKTILTM